jgi:hypothetical protein
VLWADPLLAVSPSSIDANVYAAGYFIYDVLICTWEYSEHGAAFFVHGALCCFSYCHGLLRGKIHYFAVGFLLWELSTPVMYVRWAMLKKGMAGTVWMRRVDVMFAAVFFGCRIVFGSGERRFCESLSCLSFFLSFFLYALSCLSHTMKSALNV